MCPVAVLLAEAADHVTVSASGLSAVRSQLTAAGVSSPALSNVPTAGAPVADPLFRAAAEPTMHCPMANSVPVAPLLRVWMTRSVMPPQRCGDGRRRDGPAVPEHGLRWMARPPQPEPDSRRRGGREPAVGGQPQRSAVLHVVGRDRDVRHHDGFGRRIGHRRTVGRRPRDQLHPALARRATTLAGLALDAVLALQAVRRSTSLNEKSVRAS
jgi:hypothetical protein